MFRRMKNRQPDLSVSQVKSIIDNDNIKVISFDFFDTLLVRPSIIPKDIFALLQEKARQGFDVDFCGLRYYAEEELKDEFASLDKIWDHIAKKNHLKIEDAAALKEMEMQLERDMLTVRRDTRELYETAVRSGKRIIVISDMYLPADFLMDVLQEKGFDKIEKVYVSCEEKARKSSGELYKQVVEQEKLKSPSEMLHIGDNLASDYKSAIEQGITAVYYPNIWDLTMPSDSPWGKALRNHGISKDPIIRILYSFTFLHAWNKKDNLLYGTRCFQNIETFADLLLAPMLTSISIELLCNPDIQEQYSNMFFAARDGFLPKKVYDTLGKNLKHIPSRYLYVSRQALCYTAFKNFTDYFEHSRWEGKEYLLKDFISTFITDKRVRDNVLAKLTEKEKEENLCVASDRVLRILNKTSEDLEGYFTEQKKLSEEYYKSILENEKGSQIIFDCGYSGSVSTGLNKASGLRFDKYYLWETAGNKKQDKKNKTQTICFFRGEPLLGINIIFEECFSPPEGSCLGFSRVNNTLEPLIEELKVSNEMLRDLTTMEHCCIDFAEKFEKIFRPYFSALRAEDHEVFLNISKYAFLESPYNELSVFDSVIFPDSHGPKISLSKKTYENFEMLRYYNSSFQGTMFENPDTVLSLEKIVKKPRKNYRIGIHVHLYNKYLSEEIQGYLKTIHYPFDLYVTITDKDFETVLKNLYTQKTIPLLQKLVVIPTENRGRDVAPWLVETRQYQNQYDLFCHIHSKESAQYGEGFGKQWRQYLYDNLIDGDALDVIITLFESDESLGMVFPKCYSKIKSTHNDLHIPVSGDFGEPEIIRELLKEMGANEYFTRDNYIWSMGTMMWYRPKAMAPLFNLGLQFEDFPKEPIGVGGTIAHAIERITSAVVKSSGYTSGQYNHIPELESGTVTMSGLMYPNFESVCDQIAWRIGLKNAIKVVHYANMVFCKKKLGLLEGPLPSMDSYKPYDIARNVGVKNSLSILRKTIGIFILK